MLFLDVLRVIAEVMEQEGMKCGRPIPEAEEGEEQVQADAPVGSHDNMGNQLHSQVLWDATMAYNAVQALEERPDAIMVVMVGSGHVAYGLDDPFDQDIAANGRLYLVLENGAVQCWK